MMMVDDEAIRDILEGIGCKLRDARVERYMTQSDVGEKAGVSRQLVSRIEQGFNGEISAYVAVASALNFRLGVDTVGAVDGNERAGLDFSA